MEDDPAARGPALVERIFGVRSTGQIDEAQFKAFLRQGMEENLYLEYKPRGLLVDELDKVRKPTRPSELVGFGALAKTVSGFANSSGGLLILGVREREEKRGGQVIKVKPGAVRHYRTQLRGKESNSNS